MPGPSKKSRFMQRCVADVTGQGKDLKAAFAICTAQSQKSGYSEPGSVKQTGKGAARERFFKGQPDMKRKSAAYEKAVGRGRAEEAVEVPVEAEIPPREHKRVLDTYRKHRASVGRFVRAANKLQIDDLRGHRVTDQVWHDLWFAMRGQEAEEGMRDMAAVFARLEEARWEPDAATAAGQALASGGRGMGGKLLAELQHALDVVAGSFRTLDTMYADQPAWKSQDLTRRRARVAALADLEEALGLLASRADNAQKSLRLFGRGKGA